MRTFESEKVRKWLEAIKDAGCSVKIERMQCKEPIAGYFDHKSNTIRICENIDNQENTLIHELIHAYEYH
jgi:hypothetical protein